MLSCCLYLVESFYFFIFLPWRLQLTHLVAVSRVTTFSFEIYHVWHRILFVSMATKPPKSQLNIRCGIKLKGKWRCNFGDVQLHADICSLQFLQEKGAVEIAHVLYRCCAVTDKKWFLGHCLQGELTPGKLLPISSSSMYLLIRIYRTGRLDVAAILLL